MFEYVENWEISTGDGCYGDCRAVIIGKKIGAPFMQELDDARLSSLSGRHDEGSLLSTVIAERQLGICAVLQQSPASFVFTPAVSFNHMQ